MLLQSSSNISTFSKAQEAADFILLHHKPEITWHPLTEEWPNIFSKLFSGREGFRYTNNCPKFCTLKIHGYETIVKNEEEYTGLNFNPEWNTREIQLSEAVLELERGSWKQNLSATWQTMLNLQKNGFFFSVFYAEGMRCPHIHLYNLFPGLRDWSEKEMSMALFCRRYVPFEYFHLLDTSLFGQHWIALEFAVHYKTGKPLNLIWSNNARKKSS